MRKLKQSKTSERELKREYDKYVKRVGLGKAYSYQQWKNTQLSLSEFVEKKLKGGYKKHE